MIPDLLPPFVAGFVAVDGLAFAAGAGCATATIVVRTNSVEAKRTFFIGYIARTLGFFRAAWLSFLQLIKRGESVRVQDV